MRYIFALLLLFMSSQAAQAFVVTAHSKNAALPVIVINKALGDLIPLRKLPKPFRPIVPTRQGPGIAAFHWTYWDKVYGYAWLNVDKKGRGVLTFRFTNGARWEAAQIGARVDFLDAKKQVIASLSSSKRVKTALFHGNREVDDAHKINRPVDWWKAVAYLRFYYWHEELLAPKPEQIQTCQLIEFVKNGGICYSTPSPTDAITD